MYVDFGGDSLYSCSLPRCSFTKSVCTEPQNRYSYCLQGVSRAFAASCRQSKMCMWLHVTIGPGTQCRLSSAEILNFTLAFLFPTFLFYSHLFCIIIPLLFHLVYISVTDIAVILNILRLWTSVSTSASVFYIHKLSGSILKTVFQDYLLKGWWRVTTRDST